MFELEPSFPATLRAAEVNVLFAEAGALEDGGKVKLEILAGLKLAKKEAKKNNLPAADAAVFFFFVFFTEVNTFKLPVAALNRGRMLTYTSFSSATLPRNSS